MSRAIHNAAACREALARLPELDLGELRRQWRVLDKTASPPHLSRALLMRAAAPCSLPLFWLRKSAGYLTRGGCGEVVDRALHTIALTAAARRGHLVVIGRLRLQTVHTHAEDRL